MNNIFMIELNASQMQDINGGGPISYWTGFLVETVEIAAENVWDFISAPKVGGDTLMNCM